MKRDPGSNYTFTLVEAQNSLAPGSNESTGLDHLNNPSATYCINVSSVGTGGTLDVKLQYSTDNSAAYYPITTRTAVIYCIVLSLSVPKLKAGR